MFQSFLNVLQDAVQHEEPTSTAITVCIGNVHCGHCKIVIVAPLLTAVDKHGKLSLKLLWKVFLP
jgi:hypothetical protein